MQRLAYMTLLTLLIASTACGTTGNDAFTPDATDNTSTQPLFSGNSQTFANVGLLMPFWGGVCMATLISPTMVLTAAHCLYKEENYANTSFDSDNYSVLFTDADGVSKVFESSRVHAFAQADALSDIVIIELSTAVNITPMPIMTHVSADALSSHVGLAGYGQLHPGDVSSLGVLHVRGTQVDSISDSQLMYGNSQADTSCFGDSGGPVIHQRQDGTYELAGVMHGGSAACDGPASASRADIHNDWVQSVIAAR